MRPHRRQAGLTPKQGHMIVEGAVERGRVDGDQATETNCSLANEVGVTDGNHAMGKGRER